MFPLFIGLLHLATAPCEFRFEVVSRHEVVVRIGDEVIEHGCPYKTQETEIEFTVSWVEGEEVKHRSVMLPLARGKRRTVVIEVTAEPTTRTC